jgi:uncharacterized membrane protein YeaQ/YmgE (transglycosylase-associated protein family)
MTVDFSGIIAWMLVALPFGLLATHLMPGHGYGRVADLAIGLIGTAIGGYIAALLSIQGQAGWVAALFATIVGSIVVTRVARALPLPRRRPV